MAAVILKDRPFRFGATRSEQARNLEREWGGSGMTEEQRDKARFLERRHGIGFPRLVDVDRVR